MEVQVSVLAAIYYGLTDMRRLPLALMTIILFITVAACVVGLVMLAARVILDV